MRWLFQHSVIRMIATKSKDEVKKMLNKSLKCAITFTILSAVNVWAASPGYLSKATDPNVVAKDNYGNCWKTSEWTPALAIVECDPHLVKKPEPPRVSQVTPPPARAPEPAPTPAPALPPKPVFEKVTLETEALFDFDKATLRPQGKDKLEDMVSKMNQYPEVDVVQISGFTDRLGSEPYNQKLSERRAAAVKNYLVERGVASSRMETVGRGESEPLTNGSCKGNKKSKQLISCLQPDRRVEIEIKVQREKS